MTFLIPSPSGSFPLSSPSGFLLSSPTGVTRGSMDTRVKHEPNQLTNVSEYKHLKNNESKPNITKTQKKIGGAIATPNPSSEKEIT